MASAGDRILLIEHDPKISDLIARQTLIPVGYYVDVVADSSAAMIPEKQSTGPGQPSGEAAYGHRPTACRARPGGEDARWRSHRDLR